MRLHRLIWTDVSEGIVVRYCRTKREAQRAASKARKEYPMRGLLQNAPIDIPGIRSTDKSAFVDWLNTNSREKLL